MKMKKITTLFALFAMAAPAWAGSPVEDAQEQLDQLHENNPGLGPDYYDWLQEVAAAEQQLQEEAAALTPEEYLDVLIGQIDEELSESANEPDPAPSMEDQIRDILYSATPIPPNANFEMGSPWDAGVHAFMMYMNDNYGEGLEAQIGQTTVNMYLDPVGTSSQLVDDAALNIPSELAYNCELEGDFSDGVCATAEEKWDDYTEAFSENPCLVGSATVLTVLGVGSTCARMLPDGPRRPRTNIDVTDTDVQLGDTRYPIDPDTGEVHVGNHSYEPDAVRPVDGHVVLQDGNHSGGGAIGQTLSGELDPNTVVGTLDGRPLTAGELTDLYEDGVLLSNNAHSGYPGFSNEQLDNMLNGYDPRLGYDPDVEGSGVVLTTADPEDIRHATLENLQDMSSDENRPIRPRPTYGQQIDDYVDSAYREQGANY